MEQLVVLFTFNDEVDLNIAVYDEDGDMYSTYT